MLLKDRQGGEGRGVREQERQGGDRRGVREQERQETIGILGTPLAFRLLRS